MDIYSRKNYCLFCDKIILKNSNMVRVWPDQCFHLICSRKLSELRITTDSKKQKKQELKSKR